MSEDTRKVVAVSVEHVVDKAAPSIFAEGWWEEDDRSHHIHGVYDASSFDAAAFDSVVRHISRELLHAFCDRDEDPLDGDATLDSETICPYDRVNGGCVLLTAKSPDSVWRYTTNVTATIEEIVQPNGDNTK